jgi:hypothetical protein
MPSLERQAPVKTAKPTMLLVCEGINTEPSYFSQFRLASLTIKSVGRGCQELVSKAIQLAKEEDYDQVWCVFDKDEIGDQAFNAAIQMAKQCGFQVAYSNQAFEYWIILHFEDHQGGSMNRSDYHGKINSYLHPLGARYDGNQKLVTEEIFALLMGQDPNLKESRTEMAIKRARKIYEQWDHASPAKEESSTTVFLLVEEILKYAEPCKA